MKRNPFKLANSRVLFLLIMPIVLYVAFSPLMPLIEPDESRYFEISDNMVDSGDYIVPRLLNVIYLEKPPLTYWASAIIFKFFGETDFTARIYVGLCTWACILLTYGIGSFLRDRMSGLYAAGILSTSLFFFIFGNFNILDIPLALYTCLATWAGYRFLAGYSKSKRWLYLLYLSCALAFLTKGLIGIVFPFATLILWLVFSDQWKRTLDLISPIGIILFLAIAVPWFILVERAHPNFLWYFFVQEHILRYTTTMHGRDNTMLLYVPVVIAGILPWTAFLGKAAWDTYREKTVFSTLPGRKFLWTWIILIVAFFSLSHSKLIPYIAPIFIPLSILIGNKLRNYEELISQRQSRHFSLNIPVLLQSLLLMAIFLLPIFLREGSELGGDLMIVHPRNLLCLIALPIFSLILLAFLPGMVEKRYPDRWFLTTYLLSGLFLISMTPFVSTFLTPYKSAYPVSQAIKKVLPAGRELYQYKIILYGIATYNEIRTPLVGDFGELNYGMKFLPKEERAHYFLTEGQFKERCNREGTIYCVTEYKDHIDEFKKTFPNNELLWSNGVYYLVKLKSGNDS
jgi:4-amino-4-deoxy-L-arabinose transferase-like glycosyltransferase